MRPRLFIPLLAIVSGAAGLLAQAPSADSLVAAWLARGPLSSWQPYQIFSSCPRMTPEQERALDLLSRAKLSPQRDRDLAAAWMVVAGCQDSRLQRWFVDHTRAAIRRGDDDVQMMSYWQALERARSPISRDFLWSTMLDVTIPESDRNLAGAYFFEPLATGERRDWYLRGFETSHMPGYVASSQSARLLKQNADDLVRAVAARVRADPRLAEQFAFTAIAESSRHFASNAARRELGQALEDGLRAGRISDARRADLSSMAQSLLR